MVIGFGELCGWVLISYLMVDKVVFIGGVDMVWYVVVNMVYNLVLVILELGGKLLIVVFDDVDFEGVVNGVVVGNFGVFG